MTPVEPLLVRVVVIVVTLAWTITLLASLYTREYEPLIYASPPMGLIVGYVTGVRILRKNGGGG